MRRDSDCRTTLSEQYGFFRTVICANVTSIRYWQCVAKISINQSINQSFICET